MANYRKVRFFVQSQSYRPAGWFIVFYGENH
ncbi:MAG: hypothetical protein ACJAUZ_001181, partial [Flavobacteriaceae bacterium]